MNQTLDPTGARGSNAGDNFHELWALDSLLSLLQPKTALGAVWLEGLSSEEEKREDARTFDALDCTRYLGGATIDTATGIEIEQLKYASVDRLKPWTEAKLAYSSARRSKNDNSIVRKLANAWAYFNNKRPDLVDKGLVKVRFVSNRPVRVAIANAVNDCREEKLQKLRTASGLDSADFSKFLPTLDFSCCGKTNRFQLRETNISRLAQHFATGEIGQFDHMLAFIRDQMMPESSKRPITLNSVLAHFCQVGAMETLFPCPTEFPKFKQLVKRDTRDLHTLVKEQQFLCLHGEGGVGKTTFIRQFIGELEPPSVAIIFDCYGNGEYLSADRTRHQPKEAVTQICNEIANLLQIPIYINQASDDHIRVLGQRLEQASKILARESQTAKLILVIDAIDNSWRAAHKFGDYRASFLAQFLTINNFSNNIRLIVSCRTGNLETLDIPDTYAKFSVGGFDHRETAQYAAHYFSDIPDRWVDEFHELSAGIPRVQFYAMYKAKDADTALGYLKPNGKSLNGIFEEFFKEAFQKSSSDESIDQFCSTILALPRPVPLKAVTAVCSISRAAIKDIINDLPGLRLDRNFISFRDEDFEQFMRDKASKNLTDSTAKVAKYLLSEHATDIYAAEHVATLLREAGLDRELIELVRHDGLPTVINDPISQKFVFEKRLSLALSVCSKINNVSEAIKISFIAADAWRTSGAIFQTILDSPRLSIQFSMKHVQDLVLYNPDRFEEHGEFYLFWALKDVRRGQLQNAESLMDRYSEWYAACRKKLEAREANDHDFREVLIPSADAVAAIVERKIRTSSPQRFLEWVDEVEDRANLVDAFGKAVSTLILCGDDDIVRKLVSVRRASGTKWRLIANVLLTLHDRNYVPKGLITDANKHLKPGIIETRELDHDAYRDGSAKELHKFLITACELLFAQKCSPKRLLPLVRKICTKAARLETNYFDHNPLKTSLTLRAYCLEQELLGQKPAGENFILKVEKSKRDKARGDQSDDRRRGNTKLINTLMPLYVSRLNAMCAKGSSQQMGQELSEAIGSLFGRFDDLNRTHYVPEARNEALEAVAMLLFCAKIVPLDLFSALSQDSSKGWLSRSHAKLCGILAVNPDTHDEIIKLAATARGEIRNTRTQARDKIDSLMAFAVLLSNIAPEGDAEALFSDAIAIAEEVDETAYDDLQVSSLITSNGDQFPDQELRTYAARDLLVYTDDTRNCLEGYDHFPWSPVTHAIATLNLNMAFAALSRWEDNNKSDRADNLQTLLKYLLRAKKIDAKSAIALLPLAEDLTVELFDRILADDQQINANVLEELARFLLLYDASTSNYELLKRTRTHQKFDQTLLYSSSVAAFEAFFHELSKERKNAVSPSALTTTKRKSGLKKNAQVDYSKAPLTSSKDLWEFINSANKKTNHNDYSLTSLRGVISEIRKTIRIKKRAQYVSAISGLPVGDYEVDTLINELAYCAQEWGSSHSVLSAISDGLVGLVTTNFAGFAYALSSHPGTVMVLLSQSDCDRDSLSSVILRQLGKHAESLRYKELIFLNAFLTILQPADRQQDIVSWYFSHLVNRVPKNDQQVWDLTQIPNSVNNAVARLVFAAMSDVFTTTRWRGAHCIRFMARLGLEDVLQCLIEVYSRIDEPVYREPTMPFYWQAARQWLITSLERISFEAPHTLKGHSQFLMDVTFSNEFPHFLVKNAAYRTLKQLESEGIIQIKPELNLKLSSAVNPNVIDTSDLEYSDRKIVVFSEKEQASGFNFDWMDTLDYWYKPVVELLENVTGDEFLKCADKWITHEWQGDSKARLWDHEPRKDRLYNNGGMLNRHGSLPIVERYQTFLEWHGLWCAFGELAARNAIFIDLESPGEYGSLEYTKAEYAPFHGGLWLSDLRTPTPMEKRFWAPPTEYSSQINDWFKATEGYDFLQELLPNSAKDSIVLAGNIYSSNRDIVESVDIDGAFVTPGSARSLLEILQSTASHYDAHLPYEGSEHFSDRPPVFVLKSTYRSGKGDSEYDSHDPFRFGVKGLPLIPSDFVMGNLERACSRFRPFDIATYSKLGLQLQNWSSDPVPTNGDYQQHRRFSGVMISSGQRVLLDQSKLELMLAKIELDLIVCVKIDRHRTYENKRYKNEDDIEEAKNWKVYILRQNGKIEDITGNIGTWNTTAKAA